MRFSSMPSYQDEQTEYTPSTVQELLLQWIMSAVRSSPSKHVHAVLLSYPLCSPKHGVCETAPRVTRCAGSFKTKYVHILERAPAGSQVERIRYDWKPLSNAVSKINEQGRACGKLFDSNNAHAIMIGFILDACANYPPPPPSRISEQCPKQRN